MIEDTGMTCFSIRWSFLVLICLLISDANLHGQAVAELPPELAIPETDEGLPGAGPIRRADWFHDIWNKRRADWAGREQQDQGALVFLGDSITQGWGDDFGNAFEGVKTANRGISGDTTRGMLIRLEKDVIALNPSGVVMLMGTNDIDEQSSAGTIAGNVKLIIEALQKYNSAMPIVLCQVMPASAKMNRPADKIRELNAKYQQLAKEFPQVTVLDIWTLFANSEGDAKLEEFPDLLHPNEAGYAKWAAALKPILATLGFLETEPDDFQVEEGFESLFNGRDLSGWCYRPTPKDDLAARENWRKNDPNAPPWPVITGQVSFDGQSMTTDGRYLAKNGRLVVTTPSDGRKIQQIWTEREFPNDFTLKLEFRATPNADSGIYLRGPQLQCRDYPLAGPYKELKNYKPQDWNEIVVEVKGGVAHCTCNGEILEAAFKVPATGPIGLEGDRGQMEYRRIRVKEMK
jgi:lysophospholipase L1-like esterase